LATKQSFFRSTINSSADLKTNKQARDAQSQKSKAQKKANGKHKQK
jgi:hypothetical protein